jgi:uncharacterized protein with PIN domain
MSYIKIGRKIFVFVFIILFCDNCTTSLWVGLNYESLHEVQKVNEWSLW